MSRQLVNSVTRSLSIASAALLIHVGSAAAATPQNDFQRQVSAVLAGNIASHSSLRADSARSEAAHSNRDTQRFAQQLLLGWSASHPARTSAAMEPQSPAASEVIEQDPASQADVQIAVQRFLRGVNAARGT